MAPQKISDLGEIMQIAFVPQDFDATIQHWVKMGAGPFFVLRKTIPEWGTSYGVEAKIDMDVALGQWGAMQIEVIRQNSAEKSIYSDWYNSKKEGVHHTCIVVEDINAAKQLIKDKGCKIVFEGRAAGAEWFYADTGGGQGTYLEVIEFGEASNMLMGMIRDAAKGWDGKDPIRELALG
jgi:hypothetical protein